MNIKKISHIIIALCILNSSLFSSPVKYIDDIVLRDSTATNPNHYFPFLGILSYGDILFGWQTQHTTSDTSYSFMETEKFLVNNMNFDDNWNLSKELDGSVNFFNVEDVGFTLGYFSPPFGMYLYSYDSEGLELGNPVRLDTPHYWVLSAARFSSGQYILVSNDNPRIWLTKFGTDGTIIGQEIQVTDNATMDYYEPIPIDVDNDGSTAITWTTSQHGNMDIYMSRYSNEGLQLDSSLMVNDYSWGTHQKESSLSLQNNGNIIIAWTDFRNGSINSDIYAQIYNSQGVPIGENFQVNDDSTLLPQGHPNVGVNNEGKFVIQWVTFSDSNSVFARAYTEEGSPVGGSFLIASDIKIHSNSIFYGTKFELVGDSLITIWVSNNGAIQVNAYKEVFGDVTSFDKSTLISEFSLKQNYPNPFNPNTNIVYELPEKSSVKLTVFDLAGREVSILEQAEKLKGKYEIQWNGIDKAGNQINTGIYLCRLEAGSYNQTIKMVYLK